MRVPERNGRNSGSANMTPMIDVVFLLIIFFLVSSHLARQEQRIPLDLPMAEVAEDLIDEKDRLIINVLDSGQWQVGGNNVGDEQLAGILKSHRDEHGEDAIVRIRTDRTVPYGKISPILRAAAESGLWNASFSVNREGR